MESLAASLREQIIYKLYQPDHSDQGEWLMCRQRGEKTNRDCIVLKPSPLFPPPSSLTGPTYFHEYSFDQIHWQGKPISNVAELKIYPIEPHYNKDGKLIFAEAEIFQAQLFVGRYQVFPTRQRWT